ncbi:MAG TPA: hypothetical protein PLU87_08290 [Sedimentisphaerales bacterium]|nr:hypothetical protein [Sedimentisphaerales bacterium]HRS10840.1 hypothetical protein [Sedimentisphaerales bacterium]HRV47546.1 hypothetical protein [Sedimentisphaerales bacterium]
MAKALFIPQGYECLDVAEQSESDFPNESCVKPSVFCPATEAQGEGQVVAAKGWHVIVYDAAIQQAEDQRDIEDSLDALKEPPGVSLDDLRRELGA